MRKDFRYFNVKGKKEKFALMAINYSRRHDADDHAYQLRKKGHCVRVISGKDVYRKKRYYLYKSIKRWFPNPYVR